MPELTTTIISDFIIPSDGNRQDCAVHATSRRCTASMMYSRVGGEPRRCPFYAQTGWLAGSELCIMLYYSLGRSLSLVRNSLGHNSSRCRVKGQHSTSFRSETRKSRQFYSHKLGPVLKKRIEMTEKAKKIAFQATPRRLGLQSITLNVNSLDRASKRRSASRYVLKCSHILLAFF